MLIESAESLAMGETLTVELPRSGLHEATVVWSSTNFYGCRFAEPLPPVAMSAAVLKAFPAKRTEPQKPLRAHSPFAERLADLRRTRGWGMEELAQRLGVSRQSVWYWESGQRLPKAAMLAQIAKQFGVSERELLQSPARSERTASDLQLWKSQIADRFGIDPDKVRILIEL